MKKKSMGNKQRKKKEHENAVVGDIEVIVRKGKLKEQKEQKKIENKHDYARGTSSIESA